MVWLVYSFQVLVILAAIGIIMLQKAGDGIFSSSKVFGIRGRSSTVIRITYILGALFLVNNIALGILYKKAHREQMIKETATKIESKEAPAAEQAKPNEAQKKTDKQ